MATNIEAGTENIEALLTWRAENYLSICWALRSSQLHIAQLYQALPSKQENNIVQQGREIQSGGVSDQLEGH